MISRKKYTKDFKLEMISLVLDQGYSVAKAARSFEINANMLRRWIKEYQTDNDEQLLESNGQLTPEQEEIRHLKLENKQLKLEKQMLKEAVILFARETK